MQPKLVSTFKWCNELEEFTFDFTLNEFDENKPSASLYDVFDFWTEVMDQGSSFSIFDGAVKVSASSYIIAYDKAKAIVTKLNDMNVNMWAVSCLSVAEVRKILEEYDIRNNLTSSELESKKNYANS